MLAQGRLPFTLGLRTMRVVPLRGYFRKSLRGKKALLPNARDVGMRTPLHSRAPLEGSSRESGARDQEEQQ